MTLSFLQLIAIRTLPAHVRAITIASIARSITLQATKGALIVHAELLWSARVWTLLLQALINVDTSCLRVHAPALLTLAAALGTTSRAASFPTGRMALCTQQFLFVTE